MAAGASPHNDLLSHPEINYLYCWPLYRTILLAHSSPAAGQRERPCTAAAQQGLGELSNPDIPETDGFTFIAVRLQFDRRRVVLFVERLSDVSGLAFQLEVILHQHAIEEDRNIRWCFQRAVAVECGGHPGHVVGLPFARFAIRVRQRNGLLVDTAGLAVDVGLVVVRIENLQLIAVVAGSSGGEKHAAVAARLAASGDVR